MLHTSSVSLPIADPLALIDTTLVFIIQMLIARHPELLGSHSARAPCRSIPMIRSVSDVFDAVCALQYELDAYAILVPDDVFSPQDATWHVDNDGIPF